MTDYDALAKALHDPAGIFSFDADDYPLVVEFIAMQRMADAENIADREVDDTQVDLAQRWLHGVLKPDGMTDAEWEFWRRPEWTPEEIARMQARRAGPPHYFRSVAEYERWNAFEGNPSGWFPD